MAGGAGLAPAKRGPGRPKGSGNKRAKDLAGYVAARFGGSAAQQMAAVAMVTPAEVRQAGGVLAARIEKARELGKAIGCSTKEAFDILSKELAALAPYTDQRQPLAVEAVGDGFRPDVVFMAAAPQLHQVGGDTEIAGDFRVLDVEVSRPKSHEEGQAADIAGLLPLEPSDG